MFWLQTVFGADRRKAQLTASAWLYHRDIFQALLERERMRVDRNGSLFSLLVITCSASDFSDSIEQLAQILQKRIRQTDTAGWFDGRRVGVILPDTSGSGALKLANDLSALHGHDKRVPRFDIYVHPLGHPDSGEEGEGPSKREQALTDTVLEDAFGETDAPQPAAGSVAAPVQFRRRDEKHLASSMQPSFMGVETLFLQPTPVWKRALDVLGASIGLVLLSPLFAVAALAIKWVSPGPVIFTQEREGHGGRIFTMYKFRTMCLDAEAQKAQLRKFSEQDGPAFKLTNDPRVIRGGQFLRKTCIDELPQLWNVLRGEMSLVGPRPLPVDESRRCLSWQRRRLEVRPGLTCIWQVEGGVSVTFEQWMRMDLRYRAVPSPSQDVGLLWKTFTKVLLRRASR